MTAVSSARVDTTEAGLPRPRSPFSALARTLGEWLPGVPLLLLILLVLVIPAILLIVGSFQQHGSLTLDNWVNVLTRKGDQVTILTSLSLAATVATISALVGTPLAWLISRMHSVQRGSWLALLTVGGNFGGIGLGFAFLAVLGTVGMLTLSIQAVAPGFSPPKPASFQGLVLGYARAFSTRLRGTAAYGMNRAKGVAAVDNRHLREVFVNLIYAPFQGVELGVEYIHGVRRTFAGEGGTLSRFDLMARYSF